MSAGDPVPTSTAPDPLCAWCGKPILLTDAYTIVAVLNEKAKIYHVECWGVVESGTA